MRFDVLTLFPEMIEAVVSTSIIGRAREAGHIEVAATNIRDYSTNKHKKVDDYPYGGGTGLVMSPQPIYDAWKAVCGAAVKKPRCIYLSPQGKVLTQQHARELLQEEHLILLCGHYEGVDERIIEEIVDEEISVGDYVLTGGELPALILIDAVARMVPGVLPGEEAYTEESHYNGLLEYPHYTRPPEFAGRGIPEILTSGHHGNIAKWRRAQQLKRTKDKRPDLFSHFSPDKSDARLLKILDDENLRNNLPDCKL